MHGDIEINLDIDHEIDLVIDDLDGSLSFEINIENCSHDESFSIDTGDSEGEYYEQEVEEASRPNHHFDGCPDCMAYRNRFMVHPPFRGSNINYK